MAIIIPSKQIYELNNPKVIENAIKAIDLTQQKNDIVLIENKNGISQELEVLDENTTNHQKNERIFPTTTYGQGYMFSAGIKTEVLWGNSHIELPRFYGNEDWLNNSYIEKIAPTLSAEFEVTISTVNAVSYIGLVPEGQERFDFLSDKVYYSRQSSAREYSYDDLKTKYDYVRNFKTESALTITPQNISCEFSVLSTLDDVAEADKSLSFIKLNSALSNVDYIYPYNITYKETAEDFSVAVSIAKNFKVWIASDYASTNLQDAAISRPVEAYCYEFKLKNATIFFNEKLRKLQVESLPEYINNKNAIGEKTFSIGSNQFVRFETKYNGQNDANATTILYFETLTNYQSGKETANLRCSINDYYDTSGNKVVSIDNSKKMLLELYDDVLPMSLNSWGTDTPISYNQNGLAKVFQVVSSQAIADGAAWQELTIRESGEIEYVVQLPAPTLSLSESTLSIFDKSGEADRFRIFVDGVFSKTLSYQNTLDLSTLDLGAGTHSIYAISVASSGKYRMSDKSNTVKFLVKKTTYYTEENSSGGLTFYITSNDYSAIYGNYIIGENSNESQ